jgi:hypothetical protein
MDVDGPAGIEDDWLQGLDAALAGQSSASAGAESQTAYHFWSH